MRRIELTITALSPLALGRQKPGGSISEAESYIPGSVIRGAIASQILQRANQRNSDLSQNGGDFQSLFLGENPAIFQNAYPAIAKIGKDQHEAVPDEVQVLPATAVSSKANPGFKSEDDDKPEDKKRGGVFDTLIDRFCADAYNHPYDPSCPKDKGRVEPYTGFYSKTSDNKYRSHSVSTRFLTRVGINRRRATAEEEILYSIEVLNESFLKNTQAKTKDWEPVVYRSVVIANDDLSSKLLQFINDNSGAFSLGGSASRGLGKVKIEAKKTGNSSEVQSRFDSFQNQLKERWNLWSVFGNPKEDLLDSRAYFTIDLQSDAIFTEQWRRTTVISPAMLCEFVSHEFLKRYEAETDKFLKLHVAYSSHDYRSGWNAAWGLMKDVELVTNKGAVYLFSTTKDKENDWVEALKKLEREGVGDRTCEGFGQIQVCNEFHTVFREYPV
ncbi:type III-D CRISPR-associated RAMP protein Csx10 [Allocoleopsis franciscana]|uniref:CRISPR-associated RAMP protein, Csx10 family n=1 Tax=Allocoleopsis franciscana PCC 7113 TaxID=1173027 RepID=K9WP57_9CYAN|nr:CRISPR-associated RAMP protein Csx10 [Allocoleopsis franciscana]AFZ22175.1 CRISPR-associated RAMP protein, Csx10 family [Allocoleopsis franciscana PCC 7113]